MRIMTTLDTIRLKIEVLLSSSYGTGPLRSDTRLQHRLCMRQSVGAVLMSLYSIATDSNGPLAADHAHHDAARYDTAKK